MAGSVRRWRLGAVVVLVAATACAHDVGARGGTATCGLPDTQHCRPTWDRVDRAVPRFLPGTAITNPLFPVTATDQVIQLGVEDGKPSRAEVTRLDGTRVITWRGRPVQATRSQFVAYRGGELVEVAIDYFAQAADGAVWYLGEDVSNYRHGVVHDHEGTWLAGKDGPPGMIMPAHPHVGDVYRSENIPGLVFEEDVIRATPVSAPGPRGVVGGGIRIDEFPEDGDIEHKTFMPGYGEFTIRANAERGTVAVAVPVDARPGPMPAEVAALHTAVADVQALLAAQDSAGARARGSAVSATWITLRQLSLPPVIRDRLSQSVRALTAALRRDDQRAAARAATDVALAALDLQLLYAPREAVDVHRIGVWARETMIESSAVHPGDMAGDAAVIEAIAARTPAAHDLHDAIADLRVNADAGNAGGAAEAAARLTAMTASA